MKLFYGLLAFVFFFIFGFFYTYTPAPKKAVFYWFSTGIRKTDEAWFLPLQAEFKKRGYILKTQLDGFEPQPDMVIFAFPTFPIELYPDQDIYVMAFETPLSLSQPLPVSVQNRAKKIFTWRRDLVDNKKTFYLPAGMIQHSAKNPNVSEKNVLATQVFTYFGTQSYQRRRDVVTWFLKNHPTDLEFYGRSWGEMRKEFPLKEQKAFDRQYKGYASDKLAVLNKSRFNFAYENFSHPHYVSEKIYDALLAGTVPIYLGAPNITDYVPKECFVDKRDFADYETLYAFLKNMPDEQYRAYLDCAKNFLASQEAHNRTGAVVAKYLADEIFE